MSETKELSVGNEKALTSDTPILEKLMVAVSNGMPVEALEKFMDLAERQQALEARQAYNRAFAKFKANPPKIVKDSLVDFRKRDGTRTTYKHATIGNVVSAIIAGMSEHGLSHNWILGQDGGMITVTCRITHELGHYEETTLRAAADQSGGKNSIQAICSTVTYLERYTLQAATGIAVLDEDDDGAGHIDPKNAQQPQKQQQQQEKSQLEKWENWVDSFANNGELGSFSDAWEEYGPTAKKQLNNADYKKLETAVREMKMYLEEK